MAQASQQVVKGILVVHGVGAQAPGETVRKLLKGLQRVAGARAPDAPGAGPVTAEIAGIPLRLYEVHWADLLQGRSTEGTFSAREFQAVAWFPWLNCRKRVYPAGAYSAATILCWTLALPLLSIALALPYYGARLLAQLLDRKAREQLHAAPGNASSRSFWRDAKARANLAANQRTVLEETVDEYVGDVFNYVNSAGGARFPEGREIDVPQSVQKAYDEIAGRFRTQLLLAAKECDELQVLAHSLGTVVSYHGLFGLRREGVPEDRDPALEAARGKVTRLYTIGSPLEKIGFFWPKLLNPEVPPARRSLHWENFVSWFDPVAGVLERFNQWGTVRNQRLLGGGFVTGHVLYERHPKFLRRFVAGLGAGAVTIKYSRWQRVRDWAVLLGETLLAPLGLTLITLAGGALWLAVAFLLPWLVSLLFRLDFMPHVDQAVFARVGMGFAVAMVLVFLINSRNCARRIHAAAWARGCSESGARG